MPGFIAAVSIRYAGGGVGSWGRAASFGGNGRSAGGGVWTTSSLFAGGGNSAIATSPMGDEAGIAVVGTPACRGSEGVCIRVINCLSVSPGPPSIGSKPSFWGTVAQPHPDVRRRRMGITARCTFLIQAIYHKFNDMPSSAFRCRSSSFQATLSSPFGASFECGIIRASIGKPLFRTREESS